MLLKDKVAIVTGAASGFGKETALLFANEGAKVVVVDYNASGQTVTDEIKKMVVNLYLLKLMFPLKKTLKTLLIRLCRLLAK